MILPGRHIKGFKLSQVYPSSITASRNQTLDTSVSSMSLIRSKC
ncbi:hypothetical protein PL9631_740021 [Planktothrix paucivesiculata PCC 9631]|uniref:Uncharacterized protein n=1 Tax=Planktothrix paucivesiculata PCC 9631 TaxID=671071 RepID=A0A7Z9BYH1_9CYAN|nr:hypothetical protein PL9631_740021 [Planktothrix paucivesiculata PCC 9631]